MIDTVAEKQRIIEQINRIKFKEKMTVYYGELKHEENIVGYYLEAKSMLYRVYEVKPGYELIYHGASEDELAAIEMLLKLIKRKSAVKPKGTAKPPSGWKIISGTDNSDK